jgi:hypothetical protein
MFLHFIAATIQTDTNLQAISVTNATLATVVVVVEVAMVETSKTSIPTKTGRIYTTSRNNNKTSPIVSSFTILLLPFMLTLFISQKEETRRSLLDSCRK